MVLLLPPSNTSAVWRLGVSEAAPLQYIAGGGKEEEEKATICDLSTDQFTGSTVTTVNELGRRACLTSLFRGDYTIIQ